VNLRGSRIVVVGGVRKMGRALALDLAAHGAAVCVTTRRGGPEADRQVRALTAGGAAAAAVVTGDVRTANGAVALVATAADALGGLDALVFAASGPFSPSPPQDTTEDSWDVSFDTIVKGFFFAACAARARMLERPPPLRGPEAGVIVALTDLLGVRPSAAFAAHGAAKAAQIHLVRELAAAWDSDGIRVCGIAPGPLDLPDDERRAATLRAAGGDAGRLVGPADVANAVRFCLETAGVTGVDITVDRGALLRH